MKKYYIKKIKEKMIKAGFPLCIEGKNGGYHCKTCILIYKRKLI